MSGQQVKSEQKFLYFFNGTPHCFVVRATNPKYSLEKMEFDVEGFGLRLQIPGIPDDENIFMTNLKPFECLRVRTVSFCWGKTKIVK